ncbi:MAG: hypothetical protein V4731_18350 [Pseudomonadota bacterium]
MPRSLQFLHCLGRRSGVALISALCITAGLNGTAISQTTSPVVRFSGTVVSATPTTLIVKTRGGEVVDLAFAEKLVVSEVVPIRLEDIQPGSYIGTAAIPQPDGTQRAIAVSVFPETSRGSNEGHRPFDLIAQSTMTNATVSDVGAMANTPSGRVLRLKYKDGEKTVVVPPEVPVTTSRPGDRSLLVPGASVSVFAQEVAGKPTALRLNAGRNGFVLPY